MRGSRDFKVTMTIWRIEKSMTLKVSRCLVTLSDFTKTRFTFVGVTLKYEMDILGRVHT